MGMFKGYIFDLDGVVCHTDKFHYSAWKKISDDLGIKFSENINNLLRGVSRKESLEIILSFSDKKISDAEKEKIIKSKNDLYVKSLEKINKDFLDDGVEEVLRNLKEKNKKVALASSSKNAKLILNKLEIISYFTIIIDGNNITYSKPNPEIFEKAVSSLGLDKSDCLVIEDADSGIKAAKIAGIKVCGLGNNFTEEVNYKLNHIKELFKLID
ncbi:beta-phosphoglucomutase [Pseudoleptotrichia goodfellowii]|jgi:beta-phosphoglucomutase|uniref:Beta-phosphoglucomutase n=2 Tax=Pseudoleptotrichia goodfellowii TaxID=157692 RepID=D0GPR0_9FUSO|nr:beta-phosphoglucomutase [Pseudoleptotrichia goodfellowii]EEY33919.1 beta-phosphoglucomutase [Pseudoleptotrichia goodfellowii F0264]BBM36954.1 beta-phosphoglucomutase [Pseudoleptotrichia goodfellowii]